MRILITGGAGFVGRHLSRALIHEGHAVRVLDKLVPQVHPERCRPPDLHPEAELLCGDVCNQAAVAEALEGIEAVFHLAAEVGVGQSMYEIPRFVRTNALGTGVLLQEIVQRRTQIKKVVVASSMTLYGEGCGSCPIHGIVHPSLRAVKRLEQREWDTLCPHCSTPLSPAPTPETKLPNPTSVYAVSKRGQEEYCLAVGRAYGIPTVALRYFNIFGAGQALGNPYTGLVSIFCNRLLSGEPVLIYEDGRQSRDLVHVRDIVQANILALKASEGDYQAFNVSSGELWTVAEVAELVRDALGVPGEIRILHQYRAGDTRHCHADLSQIRTRLGYEPRVGLRTGLPEVVRWARTEAGVPRPNRPDSTGPAQAERELLAFGLLR